MKSIKGGEESFFYKIIFKFEIYNNIKTNTIMKKLSLALLSLAFLGLFSCAEKTPKEKVQDATENVIDKVEEVKDKIEDEAGNVDVEKLEEEMGDIEN